MLGCGRMMYEYPVALISPTYYASSFALSARWTLQVALRLVSALMFDSTVMG